MVRSVGVDAIATIVRDIERHKKVVGDVMLIVFVAIHDTITIGVQMMEVELDAPEWFIRRNLSITIGIVPIENLIKPSSGKRLIDLVTRDNAIAVHVESCDI